MLERGVHLGIGGVSGHLFVSRQLVLCHNNSRIVRFSPPDSIETLVFSTNFHTLCPRRSPLRTTVSNETDVGG